MAAAGVVVVVVVAVANGVVVVGDFINCCYNGKLNKLKLEPRTASRARATQKPMSRPMPMPMSSLTSMSTSTSKLSCCHVEALFELCSQRARRARSPEGPLSMEYISVTERDACFPLLCTCYSLDRNQLVIVTAIYPKRACTYANTNTCVTAHMHMWLAVAVCGCYVELLLCILCLS